MLRNNVGLIIWNVDKKNESVPENLNLIFFFIFMKNFRWLIFERLQILIIKFLWYKGPVLVCRPKRYIAWLAIIGRNPSRSSY